VPAIDAAESSKPIGHRVVPIKIANPLWGTPRVHGELLKLGIDVGQTSVAKYMARHRRPPSQTKSAASSFVLKIHCGTRFLRGCRLRIQALLYTVAAVIPSGIKRERGGRADEWPLKAERSLSGSDP
jgi:hypothetical protein